MNHFLLEKRNSQKTLSAAAREKREAGKHEMMLENRLAMLQTEEFNNFKKIEETKKKALETYLRKKQAKEHYDAKMALKRKRAEDLGRDTHNFTQLRKQQEHNLIQVREELRQLKHDEFIRIKQQQEYNEMKRNNYLQTIHQFNVDRRMNIQKQINEASLRKKEFFETKLKNFREQYEERIREAEREKRKKELRISQLEESETTLISRLQLTQKLQEEALRELQVAMEEPVEVYRKTFISRTPGTKKSKHFNYSNEVTPSPKRPPPLKRVKSGANLGYGEHSIRERQNKIQEAFRSISIPNFRRIAYKNPNEVTLSEGPGHKSHMLADDENDTIQHAMVLNEVIDVGGGIRPTTHQLNRTTDK